MTEKFAADVLICGAGAAGLTLAIELARRGVSFRLIEKRSEARCGVAARCISSILAIPAHHSRWRDRNTAAA